jgi:hypothetical protein
MKAFLKPYYLYRVNILKFRKLFQLKNVYTLYIEKSMQSYQKNKF